MNIGKRLSEERRKAGFSRQEQLGKKIDVSFTTISRREKEESPIPSDKLLLMANLGLDINYKEKPPPVAVLSLKTMPSSRFITLKSLPGMVTLLTQRILSLICHFQNTACANKAYHPKTYLALLLRDTLMIDHTKTRADGGVFVLKVGQTVFVKRLIEEKGSVRVISDNKTYDAWTLEKSDYVEIIGKTVWQEQWD